MAIGIRQLGPDDDAVLATIALEAPDFDLAGRSEPDKPLGSEAAAEYLSDPAVVHWVAEDDGRVVGELLCHVLRLPFGEGRELFLYSIGVRESYRRRGVGAALLREMFAWMERQAVSLVWVLADNPGAEDFYAAQGFTRGGPNEQGVLMLIDRAPSS